MSEEKLQLFKRVLDMMGEAGESGFWLALIWLGETYFMAVVLAAVVLTIVFVAARFFYHQSDLEHFVDNVRRRARLSDIGELTHHEKRRVYELIDRGLTFEKQRYTKDDCHEP